MESKFLKRNKNKSALAALLLLLRRHKVLTLLLILVLITSGLLAGPSSLILRLPGGTRAAAGIAWLAQKAGMDVSRWGLTPSQRRSFGDLLAAFREAKKFNASHPGWGSFFAGNGGALAGGAAAAGGQGSLDFVRGTRADLVGGGPNGGKGASPTGIAAAVDPNEARHDRAGGVVQLNSEDVGGQREGWVKSAFAGGFFNGLFGSGGAAGGSGSGGSLSGGAYAGKGFFNGGGGSASADSNWDALLKSGLAGTSATSVPKSRNARGASGRISAMRVQGSTKRGMSGLALAKSINNGQAAYTQAAAGSAFARYAAADGRAPENANAANSIVFDGTQPSDTILAGASGATGDVPGMGAADSIDGQMALAQQRQTCAEKVNACETAKQPAIALQGQQQTQMNNLVSQLPGACGDPCNCGPCNSLISNIHNLCGQLNQTVSNINAPCDLPSYCSDPQINIVATPDSTAQNSGQQMCGPPNASCGCGGGFGGAVCGIMCALGS